MQTHWQIKGERKLLLLFSGWAMDENPTLNFEAEDADICTCFDYRTFESADITTWQSYNEVVLVAWSTGVWAAEHILSGTKLPIIKAIAINGTPTTVHDETGIPWKIFQGTYENLNRQNMQKFLRRMTGTANAYTCFSEIAPKREFEGQREELASILSFNFNKSGNLSLKWDKVFIGKKDAIFPVKNQLRYWQGQTEIVELEMPHYPFFELNNYNDL